VQPVDADPTEPGGHTHAPPLLTNGGIQVEQGMDCDVVVEPAGQQNENEVTGDTAPAVVVPGGQATQPVPLTQTVSGEHGTHTPFTGGP